MKTLKHYLIPVAMALGAWVFATFLDVIPAEVAPTCRPELKQYRSTLTSMQSLYGLGVAFLGRVYRPVEATPWACVGVSLGSLATGGLLGHWLVVRFSRRSNGQMARAGARACRAGKTSTS